MTENKFNKTEEFIYYNLRNHYLKRLLKNILIYGKVIL